MIQCELCHLNKSKAIRIDDITMCITCCLTLTDKDVIDIRDFSNAEKLGQW
jgi:hypothetical protein